MPIDRDALVSLVREAGAAILEVYAGDAQAQTKQDGSPLTEADLRSHRLLAAGLRRIAAVPVLSEEDVIDYATRRHWSSFWLIDPLDGTKDFLAHNDEFTINVALIRGARPEVGVVYGPALDELYFGERGAGAYQVLGGTWRRLPSVQRWAQRHMAISRFHNVPAAAQFARENGFEHMERIGSALKFGRVARGDVCIYPRFTGTSEWDIAAGHCVLEAAGCRIVDLETGAAPVYNKPDLANHHFIAAAPTIDIAALRLPGK